MRWRLGTLAKRFKKARALIPLLRRLVYKLKRLFKKARVRVRADSDFGKSPRLLAARVKESLRRFVLHCPVDSPWARESAVFRAARPYENPPK